MKTLLKITLVLSAFVVVILSQSCATVFGGKHNTLIFNNTEHPNAQVYIDDTLVGNAKDKLFLPKQVIQHGSKLEIRAEGYESEEYIIIRKPHKWYVMGNFAIGALPLIVDLATGNLLRPYPRQFNVDLNKNNN